MSKSKHQQLIENMLVEISNELVLGEFGCDLQTFRFCHSSYRSPISSAFIRLSKHSNLENRTESAEARASEKNGPFGEEQADFAD